MRWSIIVVLNLWSLLVSATSVVWVDDRNASLVYEPRGGWNVGGTPREYEGTTTWTFSPYASCSFTFTGTGVEIVGTLDAGVSDGGYSYQIDDNPEQTVAGWQGGVTYAVPFVQVQNLPNKEHTVVIKNGGPAASKLILDAIKYTTEPLNSTDTSTPGGGSGSSLNVPALVGGLIGGLFLLGVLIAAAFFYRRRAAERAQAQAARSTTPTMSMLTPDPYPGLYHSSARLTTGMNTPVLPSYTAPQSTGSFPIGNRKERLPPQPPVIGSGSFPVGNRKERLPPQPLVIGSGSGSM